MSPARQESLVARIQFQDSASLTGNDLVAGGNAAIGEIEIQMEICQKTETTERMVCWIA
jgi:hypothetical protein